MKQRVIPEDRVIWVKSGPLRSTLSHYTINFSQMYFPGIRCNISEILNRFNTLWRPAIHSNFSQRDRHYTMSLQHGEQIQDVASSKSCSDRPASQILTFKLSNFRVAVLCNGRAPRSFSLRTKGLTHQWGQHSCAWCRDLGAASTPPRLSVPRWTAATCPLCPVQTNPKNISEYSRITKTHLFKMKTGTRTHACKPVTHTPARLPVRPHF